MTTTTEETTLLVKKVARISDTYLGIEDHGILSLNLTFEMGSGVQGTGLYNLQGPSGGPLLKRILETLGVEQWKQVGGQSVYVLYEREDYTAPVVGFETFPFDGGRRLIFKEFLEDYR